MSKLSMALKGAKELMSSKEGRQALNALFGNLSPEQLNDFDFNKIKGLSAEDKAILQANQAFEQNLAEQKAKAVYQQASTPLADEAIQAVTSDILPTFTRQLGKFNSRDKHLLADTLRAFQSTKPSMLTNHNYNDSLLEREALKHENVANHWEDITSAAADATQNISDRVFANRQRARQMAAYAYNPISAGAANYFNGIESRSLKSSKDNKTGKKTPTAKGDQ